MTTSPSDAEDFALAVSEATGIPLENLWVTEMTTRILESEYDRKLLISFIQQQELPVTVSIKTGGKRTARQNKLNRLWMAEIADQLGWSSEDARAYCKLHVGVPILREDDDEYREQYDRVFKPLPYETKIELMREPMDFPVTRLMTTKQQTRYLDEIFRHFSEKGVALTLPDEGGASHQFNDPAVELSPCRHLQVRNAPQAIYWLVHVASTPAQSQCGSGQVCPHPLPRQRPSSPSPLQARSGLRSLPIASCAPSSLALHVHDSESSFTYFVYVILTSYHVHAKSSITYMIGGTENEQCTS